VADAPGPCPCRPADRAGPWRFCPWCGRPTSAEHEGLHRLAGDLARRVRDPADRPEDLDGLRRLVERLPERPRAVVRWRYGIERLDSARPGRAATLEEIGKHLGVTRERARMVERDGLAALARRLWRLNPDKVRAAKERGAEGQREAWARRRAGDPYAAPVGRAGR
jgi:hypothetical protein